MPFDRYLKIVKTIIFSILFFPALVSAAEGTDSCFDEQGSYAIGACLDKKIEVTKKDYNTARKIFIGKISKNMDDSKELKALERKSNQLWLSFLESNCEMQASTVGDRDSPVFQTEYQGCVLEQYRDRIKFLKITQKM